MKNLQYWFALAVIVSAIVFTGARVEKAVYTVGNTLCRAETYIAVSPKYDYHQVSEQNIELENLSKLLDGTCAEVFAKSR